MWGKMDEQQGSKWRVVETEVAFVKGATKEENRWINLTVTFEGEGRKFTVRDKKTTDEEWNEAGMLLKEGKAVIYRNPPRSKTNGAETNAPATGSTSTPF